MCLERPKPCQQPSATTHVETVGRTLRTVRFSARCAWIRGRASTVVDMACWTAISGVAGVWSASGHIMRGYDAKMPRCRADGSGNRCLSLVLGHDRHCRQRCTPLPRVPRPMLTPPWSSQADNAVSASPISTSPISSAERHRSPSLSLTCPVHRHTRALTLLDQRAQSGPHTSSS